MIKNIFSSFWFWGILLVAFVTIILWDDSIEDGAKGTYVKHKMTLNNVNFSQIENGFEHARMYATVCEMDDSQTNMEARDVKVIFFKEDVATFTGRLIAASATKSPFEAKFFGDVRMWDTDNERMRTEEMRYLFNRKELSTQRPITVWKDNAVLTGLGMTYSTERKEITINQQVVIRLWEEKKEEPKPMKDIDPISGLPVAEPIEKILGNIKASDTSEISEIKASDTSEVSEIKASDTSEVSEIKASDTSEVSEIKASDTSEVSEIKASDTSEISEIKASDTSKVSEIKESDTSEVSEIKASETQNISENIIASESQTNLLTQDKNK